MARMTLCSSLRLLRTSVSWAATNSKRSEAASYSDSASGFTGPKRCRSARSVRSCAAAVTPSGSGGGDAASRRCRVCREVGSQRGDQGIPLGSPFCIRHIEGRKLGAQLLAASSRSVTLVPECVETLGQLTHELRASPLTRTQMPFFGLETLTTLREQLRKPIQSRHDDSDPVQPGGRGSARALMTCQALRDGPEPIGQRRSALLLRCSAVLRCLRLDGLPGLARHDAVSQRLRCAPCLSERL